MKNISIWQEIKTNTYPKLDKNIDVDILIIGGGITGINTLYNLKDMDKSIALVEKNKIGMGATARSSAKITFLQENIYSKLKNNFNNTIAYKYYKSQKEAIKKIVKTIKEEQIDCDLEPNNSYLYTLKESEVDKINKESDILESFNEKAKEVTKLPNNLKVKKAFWVNNTYVFHPLKYVNNLAKKSITKNHKIYENTNIDNILLKDNVYWCYTDKYIIKSKKVIIAMGYPNFLFPFGIVLKAYLEKSYLLAYKDSHNKKFNAINISNPIYSMRNYKDYEIAVGESHNLCFKNDVYKNISDLEKLINEPNPDYIWSNHDLMTLDNLPYIGYIKKNIILATGYNTWGMTNSMLAGMIIKDLLNKKANEYESIFSPKRGISKVSLYHYPLNIFSNTYSFMSSKLNKNKEWYHKNPYFIKMNNENVGIYTDENNKKHYIYNRCPHLKCSLIFNEIEKTWDCPCHGSRFDIDGKCLLGPSNYNITYEKKD